MVLFLIAALASMLGLGGNCGFRSDFDCAVVCDVASVYGVGLWLWCALICLLCLLCIDCVVRFGWLGGWFGFLCVVVISGYFLPFVFCCGSRFGVWVLWCAFVVVFPVVCLVLGGGFLCASVFGELLWFGF